MRGSRGGCWRVGCWSVAVVTTVAVVVGALSYDYRSRAADRGDAVSRALMDGDTAGFRNLVEQGADLNADTNNHIQPPLVVAAGQGNLQAIKLLLDHRADPNHADLGGTTPLMQAAMEGHSLAVQLLLSAGANPRYANRFGVTPLHNAAESGDRESVHMILEAGGDPAALEDLHRETPAGSAARMAAVCRQEMVRHPDPQHTNPAKQRLVAYLAIIELLKSHRR